MMYAGTNWSLNYTIHIDCKNISHDMGIALWLSNK